MAEFYSVVLIPPAVAEELERGKALGIDLPDLNRISWLKIQEPETSALTVENLGAGEIQVLALDRRNEVLCLSWTIGSPGEYAERSSLQFTVTLGILLRAKKKERIAHIEPLLDHLGRLGFGLSAKTRAAVLRLAAE